MDGHACLAAQSHQPQPQHLGVRCSLITPLAAFATASTHLRRALASALRMAGLVLAWW